MNKKTQQFKITIYFFIFSLGLIGTFIFIDLTFFSNQLEKTAMSKALEKIEEKEQKLSVYFNTSKAILESTRDSSYFNKYINNSYLYKNEVTEIFLTIAKINKNIMQFRFIDSMGYEKIRIDRKEYESIPIEIDENKLQNKSDRYYFKNSKNLEKNEVSFSNLDLNIEQGKIIKPFLPTLRAMLPVYVEGHFEGLLIVNYFMSEILNELINTTLYDVIILNDKAEIIKHYDDKKSWSYYNNMSNILKSEFSKDYKNIISNQLVITDSFVSKKMAINTPSKLIYLLQFNKQYHLKDKEEKIKQYLSMASIVVLLSLIMSWLFSKLYNKIFFILNSTQKQNAILGSELREKNEQLEELNKNLEKKIEEEILKNKEKDEKIFSQAKHVAMVEMLANIAHQWRQPLSFICTNASGLKLRYMYTQLEEDDIPNSMDKIISKTQYLSNTIETFKNFLSSDKEFKEIYLQDSIRISTEIIEGSLKENFIKLENNIDAINPIVISTISSELSEVLINILTNAKDILILRATKNPTIIIDINDSYKDKIIITIEDNAGGIKEKNLQRVFEPYFTTKHKSQGRGLSLHMSYRIVTQNLNGKLYVENTDLGAKFFVELPLS